MQWFISAPAYPGIDESRIRIHKEEAEPCRIAWRGWIL